MQTKRHISPVVVTLAASVAALSSHATVAAENPFAMQDLSSGYMLAENAAQNPASEHKHGTEAKGQVKAGSKKIKEGTCSAEHRKAMEGKCGGGSAAKSHTK